MAPPKGTFPGTRYEGGRTHGTMNRWHLANVPGWEGMTHNQKSAWNVANWSKTPKGREQAEHGSLIGRFQKHGMTLDQYHALAEKQDFLCALCGDEPKPRTRKDNRNHRDGFVIDHNHATRKVRGLLCYNCNVGIGMLKDSSEVLQRAATYVVKH